MAHHRLLVRQLARHLAAAARTDPALAELLAVVSRTYDQVDADRELLERSLELTSQELMARNEELSAAMRHAGLSFWALEPGPQLLSLQGYGPVGFAEVRGRAAFPIAAVLERVAPTDRAEVAAALAAPAAELDLAFRVDDGRRWVRMRGHRDRGGARLTGVWADVTLETRARLDDQARREVLERQTRSLQRLAEVLVEGTALAAGLPAMCADLCETVDVARVSVWLIDEDGAAMDCAVRYERATQAVLPTPSLALAEVPIYAQALMRSRTLAVADVATDPETEEIAARARAHGVSAMLDSACRIGGRLVGMVCYEHTGGPRAWTPEEVAFAASVADGVSLAIESQRRSRAERARATLEDGLRHAQKMESLGHLAGGVAHDLNNLLTPILICGELVREAVAHDPDLAESVDAILAAGTSARDLVAQLLGFGRKQMLQLRALDLNLVCERAVRLLQHTLPATIQVELRLTPDLSVILADAVHLQQVIVNLAINARDAMPEGGHLTITTAAALLDDAAAVMVVVEDDGAGIDAHTLPHIFEPFFTTKGVGRGSGLGLAMVYGIVKQHGGTIEVASAVGRGTRFEVRLPVPARPRLVSERIATVAGDARSPATVLVVEDDPVVLGLVTTVLRRAGYNVVDAGTPVAAIELAELLPGELDLVLTDVIMPHMNGLQMFAKIALRRPRTRVLYMSGYGQDALANDGDATLLRKPFSVEGLVAAVRAALVDDGDP